MSQQTPQEIAFAIVNDLCSWCFYAALVPVIRKRCEDRIAIVLQSERDHQEQKDQQITELQKKFAWIGTITPCPNCDGSGKNEYGDCCGIPGHAAKECKCVICQWKNAHYKQGEQIAALEEENARLKAELERKYVNR